MTRMRVIEGDITRLDVDAIVNAANAALAGGGGVDGAIHRAAGRGLLEECRTVSPCPPGQARLTGGHGLKARFVIHTVGPVWQGGHAGEAATLTSCYRSVLRIAADKQLGEIAFPAISAGIFGFPMNKACEIAARTVAERLAHETFPERVIFCMFGAAAAATMNAALATLAAGSPGTP
jgi:O-acetyl-ADP-ribose deacetylase (regulator of RNase III)